MSEAPETEKSRLASSTMAATMQGHTRRIKSNRAFALTLLMDASSDQYGTKSQSATAKQRWDDV
jgi:hypothetical protein